MNKARAAREMEALDPFRNQELAVVAHTCGICHFTFPAKIIGGKLMADNKAFVVLDSVFRLNLQSGFILNRKRLLLEQETVIRRNKMRVPWRRLITLVTKSFSSVTAVRHASKVLSSVDAVSPVASIVLCQIYTTS